MDDNMDSKSCPYCAETIAKLAKKCKHCGEIIDAQMRDIEALKRQQQNVIVNNNNNNNNNNNGNGIIVLRRFPHLFHFIFTIFTGGLWLVIWILHYLFRDRKYYV